MMRWRRRDLLKTAAGGVLLAPLLRQRRLQAQSQLPKRLLLVYTPDSHPREWWPLPAADGAGFTLQGPMLDFVGLESQLLFVRRVDHAWSYDNHHEAGVAQLFTGQRFFDEATHYANGPSIEQVLLANTPLRAGTPIADVHLCVADQGGGDKRHVVCYSGPGQPIQRERDPQRAFRRLFNDISIANPARLASRRRALALNTAELRRIQEFLGSDERARLELHVEALRDLELQIAESAPRPAAISGSCTPADPGALASTSDHDETSIRSWAKLQADLIVSAFACDRTRVAELGFGWSGSDHSGLFGLSSGTRSWHEVCHLCFNDVTRELPVTYEAGSAGAAQAWMVFDRLWASEVAYLARRLATIPEGDGSMLDNTLMYWGVESGTDHNHSPHDMQYLLIGGRNLGFATGQYLRPAEIQSAQKLHTSVLQAFGYATDGFGIEPNCGPLAGVLR